VLFPVPDRSISVRFLRRAGAFVLALALAAGSAGPLQAADSWTVLNPATDEDLIRVQFLDNDHGWAVGTDGTILRTLDGANSWTAQAVPVTEDVVDLRMFANGTGYALSHYIGGFTWENHSTVMKTVDYGQTWTIQNEFDHLYWALDFSTQLKGVLVGDQGQILTTVDGAVKWNSAQITDQQSALIPIREVKYHTSNFLLAMGGQYDQTGILWRSIDGGQTWTHTRVSGEPVFASFVFNNEDIVVVGGDLDYGAHMVRTSDGAFGTWEYTDLLVWGQAQAVAFRDGVEGWAPLGAAATYLYTNDGGLTWTSMPTPGSAMVYDVAFPSPDVGFMVGLDGAVLRYNGNSPTGVNVTPSAAAEPVLFQNAPNPFPRATQFSFSIQQRVPVTLKVYDLAGREVATVVNETMDPGHYAYDFEAGPLASGVYYYRLAAGDVVKTRQMVILK
jgi:photosystem II stability/assembly factor-like uncharacterized protein